MSEQLSVKGLTVCTPEFHAIAKKGEEQARVVSEVERICDAIYDVASSSEYPKHERSEIEYAIIDAG